jgi:hypothetical protein
MQIHKETTKQGQDSERNFFWKTGFTASDKFYVNEDMRKQKQESRKGGAKIVA